MHTISIKEEARKLRLAGKSYNEISSDLRIAKSTLHSWLSKMQLSAKAQSRISKRVHKGSLRGLMKRNINQTHLARKRMADNRAVGKAKVDDISTYHLLLIGAALYWGEGYKKLKMRNGRNITHHPVQLANSDPEIVRVFIQFLKQCFGVPIEDIKIDLHLYEHINELEAKKHWHAITGIPFKNFGKTYYGVSIASERKRTYNRLPYGTAHIRVNSTPLFHQIMGLVEALKKKI